MLIARFDCTFNVVHGAAESHVHGPGQLVSGLAGTEQLLSATSKPLRRPTRKSGHGLRQNFLREAFSRPLHRPTLCLSGHTCSHPGINIILGARYHGCITRLTTNTRSNRLELHQLLHLSMGSMTGSLPHTAQQSPHWVLLLDKMQI
jgi:hypothetical protein